MRGDAIDKSVARLGENIFRGTRGGGILYIKKIFNGVVQKFHEKE